MHRTELLKTIVKLLFLNLLNSKTRRVVTSFCESNLQISVSFSGCLVMGIGSITFSFPHFLMGPYDLGDGDGNSTSSNICSRYYKGHQNFWSYSNSRNQILMLFVMTAIWTLPFFIFFQERFSHSIRQHDIRNREFIGENPRTREVQILD